MFDGKKFMDMFRTDEDWRAFFEFARKEELDALYAHEGFLERQSHGIRQVTLRINDVRYQAECAADEEWRKSGDAREYAEQLLAVDRSLRQYEAWKRRRYADRKLIDSLDGHDRFEAAETSPVTGEKVWKEEVYA